MNIVQQILSGIAKAFQYWGQDIRKRKSLFGKGCSLSIGLFIILLACSVPMGIINGVGQAVGIVPTSTPRPSATPMPTPTPVPAATNTSTPLPTATPKPTLAPAEITATTEAILQETVIAAKIATTQAEISAQQTTEAVQTATTQAEISAQQTTEAVPTQTAAAIVAATATIEALKTTYPVVDIRDLVKSPDRYTGQKLALKGEVLTIREEKRGFLRQTVTLMQILVQVPGESQLNREAVVVEFAGVLENVFKGDYVIVYGKGAGRVTITNAYGAELVQPAVEAEYVRW